MIALLFVFLAGFFNSISDAIAQHYSSTIFCKLPKWFSNDWPEKYKAPWPLNYLYTHISDAWHLSKTLMICCFFFATLCLYFGQIELWASFWGMFLWMWLTWFISFEFFTKLWSLLYKK
jgi:hypothetical protein